MMSAAVPWMMLLAARRSPSLRTLQLLARTSGIGRRRPNSVDTYPCSTACVIESFMNCATAGKRSRYVLMKSSASFCGIFRRSARP